MFRVESNTIHCSRGDTGSIELKVPYTDTNNFVKYKDISDNVYWYDTVRRILYDENYEESSVSLSTLTLQYYEFQAGDVIKFNIYERKGYDKPLLLSKTIEIDTPTTTVDIELTEEDTTFGEIANKPIIYWYDITLNDDLTIVCYNEDGAKEFIVYPAKGSDE